MTNQFRDEDNNSWKWGLFIIILLLVFITCSVMFLQEGNKEGNESQIKTTNYNSLVLIGEDKERGIACYKSTDTSGLGCARAQK